MLIVLMRLAYLSQRATTEFPSQEQIRVELKHMAAQWMGLRILLFYLEQALVRALIAPLPPAPLTTNLGRAAGTLTVGHGSTSSLS